MAGMREGDDGAGCGSPLREHRMPLDAVLMDAIDAAAGLCRAPRTLAEYDQHQQACSDVERLVRELVDGERAAAALAEARHG